MCVCTRTCAPVHARREVCEGTYGIGETTVTLWGGEDRGNPGGQSLGEQRVWLRLVDASGAHCAELRQPIRASLVCAEGNGPPR